MTSKLKLKVGVFGNGAWGKRIAETLNTKTQHCKLFAQATRSAVLNDPWSADFVIIATPYSTHADLMAQCFERRIPFIVEKPAAPYVELNKLHEKYGTGCPDFLVNHTLLFNPAVEVMAAWAHKSGHSPVELRGEHGGAGPVRNDCNALYDYGSHGIALGLWLGGKPQTMRLEEGEPPSSVEKVSKNSQNFHLRATFGHMKLSLRVGNNYPKKRLLYTAVYDDGLTHRFREFPERELLSYAGADLIEVPFTSIDPLTNALDTFAQVVKGDREPDSRFGWTLPLETMLVLAACNQMLGDNNAP